jgi:hypothetical protein
VLTEDDVAQFIQYEAACVGMECEPLECYRYSMVFSLFLLKKKKVDKGAAAAGTAGTAAGTVGAGAAAMPEKTIRELIRKRLDSKERGDFQSADGFRDELRQAGVSMNDRSSTWECEDGRTGPWVEERVNNNSKAKGAAGAAGVASEPERNNAVPVVIPPHLQNIRPRQSRLIHGQEHVNRRWQQLGFVVASGGIRMALFLTRELLADKGDTTQISILSVNRSEAEITSYQELLDLQDKYQDRVRVTFALTEPASVEAGWTGLVGRGDVAMAQTALPAPLCSDGGVRTDEKNQGVMIMVCGKVQGDKSCEGFVELWGGKMGMKLPTTGRSPMQRIQGALGGVLADTGFSSDQVFQI